MHILFRFRILSRLADFIIAIQDRYKAILFTLYYYYLTLFYARHNILLAHTENRDLTREVICYYRFNEVYSPYGLQRWLLSRHGISVDAVTILFKSGTNAIMSRAINLDNDREKIGLLAYCEEHAIANCDISI